jgi:glycosyltransferase involved in cell wall biosynthesis
MRENINNTITIVTPSLNQGKYIEQTINSVITQFGNFNIDYIIADGGSSDGTVEILKKYDVLIKRSNFKNNCLGVEFRWWSKKDNGQSNALNNGFKLAKGDILAWINSDDYYEENAFACVFQKFLDNHNVDMIYGNCYEIFEMENKKKINKGQSSQGDFDKFLREGNLATQPATFFTKKVFDFVGGIDESLNYLMDYDLFLRILKNNLAMYIDDYLAFFRFWPNSKTVSQIDKYKKEEKLIRKKYGGSLISPLFIHNFRLKSTFLNAIKQKKPNFYFFCKNIIYKIINIF